VPCLWCLFGAEIGENREITIHAFRRMFKKRKHDASDPG
jgi:hypothetical protein